MGTRLDQVAEIITRAIDTWTMSVRDYNIIRYGMEELLHGRKFLTKNQDVAEWCMKQEELIVKSIETVDNCFWKIALKRDDED